MKALVLDVKGTVTISLFYIVKVKTSLNIYTSLNPKQTFCIRFEIVSVIKKNSINGYSGIIDSKLHIQN